MADSKEELDAEIAETLNEIKAEQGEEPAAEDPEEEPEDKGEKGEDDPEEDPAPKEEKKDDPPKGDKPEPGDDPPKGEKKPAQIPAWKLAIAAKRAAKQAPADPEKKDGEKPNAEPAHSENELDSLAKEIGADPEAVKKLDAYFAKKYGTQQLPPELQELLKEFPKLKQLQEKADAQEAEIGFANEFESEVLPLVEAEYPGAPASLLKAISQDLRKKIEEDPSLLYTPLRLIYKGDDSFRSRIKTDPKKKSAEPSHGSGGAGRKTQVIDFEKVTEADIADMDDETLEKFTAWQVEQERKK